MINIIFEKHAKLLRSLASPSRLEILHLLRNRELNVTDIHSMLNTSQSSISQHLKILKEANIIFSRREGKEIYYSIKDRRFIKASDLIRELLLENLDAKKVNEIRKLTESMEIISDPVCGMTMTPEGVAFEHLHEGKKYYFCASGCMYKFTRNTSRYIR